MAKVTIGELVTCLTDGRCGQVVQRTERFDGVTVWVQPQRWTGRETADDLDAFEVPERVLLTRATLGTPTLRPFCAARQRKVFRALWTMHGESTERAALENVATTANRLLKIMGLGPCVTGAPEAKR